jgi:hypothetical protein
MLEDKAVLLTLCEVVRANTSYLTNLHHHMTALYDALLRDHPELRKSYLEETEKTRLFPSAERLLEQLDALIQQLKQ